MLSPFICGSFNNQELAEDDRDSLSSSNGSPCTTPRKSRKASYKDSKNPYSTRGLDKFSALLAELEEKRQKIYSQVGSEDISFVRFVYSSSNDVVPIVVKMKDQHKEQIKTGGDKNEIKDKQRASNYSTETIKVDGFVNSDNKELANEQSRLQVDKITDKKKKKVTWNLKMHKWRRPSYYMPIFIILILVFLAFFGRSVAILCTSIGWYLVPTFSSKCSSASASKPVKKKQLIRRFSEISHASKNNIDTAKVIKSSHCRQNSL
ncbi:uncharacterized protein LOC126677391 [Mercurialis annua]|uniref:uncharacterized protein LOC126677391 n=1 Tax=Mercurialis annua TaxID=3986 RepID=UPI00215E130F|nr:uncharacterized protein LOC126677391 [Mercurialis annua]